MQLTSIVICRLEIYSARFSTRASQLGQLAQASLNAASSLDRKDFLTSSGQQVSGTKSIPDYLFTPVIVPAS